MKSLVILALGLLLIPAILSAQQPDVYIYYGSPNGDADTITAGVYDLLEIPVYFQAAGDDTINGTDLCLAFGINNGYIENFVPGSCAYYYPFTTWDVARFFHYDDNFRVDEAGRSWDSFTFFGLTDTLPPNPGGDYLELIPGEPPIHGLSFICRAAYRPELNDSVITDAFGPGWDQVQGLSNMGVLPGVVCPIEEKYAAVRFIAYGGAISGQVKNIDEEPIENVTVKLLEFETYTDNNGEFSFTYLPDGSYDLSLSHPDYCDEIFSDIVVDNHDTTWAPLTLEYGGAIAGIVTDPEANPLSNAVINAMGYANSDTTDNDGRYLIHGLCPGTYALTASLTGYFTDDHANIGVLNNDTALVNIEMYSIEFPPNVDVLTFAGGYFENSIWRDTIVAAPGQDIDIPIWFYGHDESASAGWLEYPLGINNAYIDSFNMQSCVYHYPLTQWDIKSFGGLNEDWRTDGEGNTWDSYAFSGTREGPPPYNSPALVTLPGDPPIEIMTFSIHVKNDPDLLNEVVSDAIDAGWNRLGFSITFGDNYGGALSHSDYFAPIKFVSYQYTPGDANMTNGIWPPQVIGSDVTYLVSYFRGSAESCLINGLYCAADVNGDCQVIGSDVTRLVSYFRGVAELAYCPDYPPAWPTADDAAVAMPEDWPGCE
jgi:hypothetical protein